MSTNQSARETGSPRHVATTGPDRLTPRAEASAEGKWRIREDLCKGCGICVARCPRKLLDLATRLSPKGFHPAQIVQEDLCTSCAVCARGCPDVAIEVYR